MTGVVKSVGKYALLAGTALALSISVASAASLTKAGMDKRVADLEREVTLLKNQMKSAMMAKPADKMIQSGNSRVKVTLYGFVNRAVRFASSGSKSDFHSIENDEVPSRLGTRAVGALNKNTSAVALIEVDMATDGGRYGTGFSEDGSQDSGGNVTLRHSVIDLSNKDLGTISIGHSAMAHASAVFSGFQGAGAAFEVGTTGTGLVPSSDKKVADGRIGIPGNVNPNRQNRILYRTPNLMGISLAVSLNQAKGYSVGMSFKSPAALSKDVSIALGAGYRAQPDSGPGGDTSTFGVSGGIQHNPSGLSVNGIYVQSLTKAGMTAKTMTSVERGRFLTTAAVGNSPAVYMYGDKLTLGKAGMAMPSSKHTGWAADVSWTGKLIEAGSTSLTIGYGSYKKGMYANTNNYWMAANQQIVSAAADIYFGVSYDTGEGVYTVAHKAGGVGTVTNGVYEAPDDYSVAGTELDDTCGAAAVNDTTATIIDGVQNDAKCSFERDGVLAILAGVRIKF